MAYMNKFKIIIINLQKNRIPLHKLQLWIYLKKKTMPQDNKNFLEINMEINNHKT